MHNIHKNLEQFIKEERAYFEGLNTGIDWASSSWGDASRMWLPIRGKTQPLPFTALGKKIKSPTLNTFPEGDLPEPYQEFCKAMIVYLQRTRGCGFAMVNAYLIAVRRIYIHLFQRKDTHPAMINLADFYAVVDDLKQVNYKNLYDACSHLKAIADVLDLKTLTHAPIYFNIDVKQTSSRHDYISLHDPVTAETQRKNDDKLPSREAMEAFAICTNNPINDNEEILLRVIDLLIAMGQRGNEVAQIPYDCWVERPKKDSHGNAILDAHSNPIVETGIRYYAEKMFQTRVHWFAAQDIPLARRAVDRLKEITKESRSVAKWQEDNAGRLWYISPDTEMLDVELMRYLSFAEKRNLRLFLEKNNIKYVRQTKGVGRGNAYDRWYRAGDIEEFMIPKIGDHVVLRESENGKLVTRLKTSEVLAIAFDGAFRFNGRQANENKVHPRGVTLTDINIALGSQEGYQSVFQRRNLTEADGSPIVLTSHQTRHWRNTIYRLSGMTDAQQALALGRSNLKQNPVYQHTTLEEDTSLHREFLKFDSVQDKVSFLHESIRNKTIQGDLTDTYHDIKDNECVESAEEFLKIHARAMHITPFGGCTHDFSQTPCVKHLQCWNDCSHLHRTQDPNEEKQIKIQIELLEKSIQLMKEHGDGEGGSDIWIRAEEGKLSNLKNSLTIKTIDIPITVFPNGKPKTIQASKRRSSSVSDN